MSPEERRAADALRAELGFGDRRVAKALGLTPDVVRGDRERQRLLLPPAPPPAGPRILLFDIETMAIKAWVWRNWKTNVVATEADWYMLSASWQWLGQEETGFVSIAQDPSFYPDTTDDRLVVQRLADLFEQADVTVAHYGDRFDTPKTNARFIYHGIPPPSPYQTVDTKKETARHFDLASYSLDETCRYLGIGRKLPHRGFELWRECAAGDPTAWAEMEAYNRHDVALLRDLYLRLRPWLGHPGKAGGGPNLGLWPQGDEEWTCPKCGAHRRTRDGTYRTRFSRYQAFRCAGCGGWSRAPFRERGHAPAV